MVLSAQLVKWPDRPAIGTVTDDQINEYREHKSKGVENGCWETTGAPSRITEDDSCIATLRWTRIVFRNQGQ